MKKIWKIVAGFLAALLLFVVCYVVYMLVSYHRIADDQELTVEAPNIDEALQEALTVGQEYTAVTYNIGFGAYTPEFSFFMDGGSDSWAVSKESVEGLVKGAAAFTDSLNADFVLLQEVDLDGTRSRHVDEYELFREDFQEYYGAFAVNYDSAFLLYPFTQPHGKNQSGIAFLSRYPITFALRRSFPISTSLTKFFDLDRCYSISRIPVENGRELVFFNLHMSAYGNSDAIREGQIAKFGEDMKKEYEAGNYVVCGGDFNHDLKNLASAEGTYESWAYPFPRESLPEHFSFGIDSFTEEEKEGMWNTSRNTDIPYTPGESYTVTLDGFILSDNVELVDYENIEMGYVYSDHDPVWMKFRLLP